MKKLSIKIVVAIMLVAVFITAFAACEKAQKNLQVTFVSEDTTYAEAKSIDEVKKYLQSQPTMDGYVFKGWYLDKDVWQQPISAENVAEYVQNGNYKVYAKWAEIVDAITVIFQDYNGGYLWENDYDRSQEINLNFIKPSARPDDDKYTYTFIEWECDMSDLSQAQYIATPKYSKEYRTFDVNYYVDGVCRFTDKVKYGDDADLDLLGELSKESTEQYEYVFEGWQGYWQNVTSDISLVAKFTQKTRKYKVVFNYGDGKSETQYVEYGKSAVAPSNTDKKNTNHYDYKFTGWDNSFSKIISNTTVNANYSQTIHLFAVRFWVDSTLIKADSVEYGQSAIEPDRVVKADDELYSYKFVGWDKSPSNVTKDLDIFAQFEKKAHEYAVKYVDWDDALIYTEKVNAGESAKYSTVPQRENSERYEYVFDGWSDSDKLLRVMHDMTVKAKYVQNERKFTVTFNYGDGMQKVVREVPYGADLTGSDDVPTDLDKAPEASQEYIFVGWDNAFDNIKSDIVINAKYVKRERMFTVNFWVDEECIKSVSVKYGESVEAPQRAVKVTDDGFTYEFTGWDKDFDNITSDTDVRALFNKISHKYTVQFVNWDGELLDTQIVESANAAVYGGADPIREPNDKFTYEFKGWSDSDRLQSVTGNMTVYAIYTDKVRTFTVTFNYGHGLTKVEENIPYGENLTNSALVPIDTAKASTKQFDFTFIDWDKYIGYISSDMEVNAIYKETIRKYTVTFVNNGSAVKTQEVAYGDCASIPSELLPKNDTVQWKYTFLGWAVADEDTIDSSEDFNGVDVDSVNVEDAVTYTAVYLREIQRYTVKFFNDEGDETALSEITVDYGTNVIEKALAPIPSKTSTPRFDYVFTNWSKELTFIASNVETFAVYSANVRSYKVTFMNGDEVHAEYTVLYEHAAPDPGIPTRNSTVEYDFVFLGWNGGYTSIVGDTVITANYRNDLRYYKVTYFNLATYELISTVEMGYGTSIATTIVRDGYDFDSWYRDPDCNTVFDMENDFVDGTMMLFGNTVMQGLIFNGNNEITGYEGTQANLVIPIAANGRKVGTIKKEAFKGNTVIGSVYIPSTITSVEEYAFSGLNLTETGGIYVQSEKKWTGTPKGWNQYWNRDSLTSWNSDNRPVTFGVDGLYTVGDYQYLLIGNGNVAIVNKFVNNNTARAYMDDKLDHKKAFFTSTVETDEKTGQERNIYQIDYVINTYSITDISVSAFEGCLNLVSIFIPETITYVGNYAFSGVTANIYIQRNKPTLGEVPTSPRAWGGKWKDNRSGQSGDKTLYWGIIGMERVGVFTYIFKNDNTAIAAEYNGSSSATSVDVPGSVVYKDVTYTVTEIGDELLSNMLMLNTVTLNEGLKKIGSKVFYMDAMLSSISLPSTLEEIGEYAFVCTMSLKEIYIPASVDKVGAFCFAGSSASIYCGQKLTLNLPPAGYILYWNIKLSFDDISKLTNVKDIAQLIFDLKFLPTYWNVAELYVDKASETGRQTNFKYALYNDGTAEIISSSNTILNVENYVIPEVVSLNGVEYRVTKIAKGAFSENTALKTLYIPASVTSIEAGAFEKCANLTISTAHASKPSGWPNDFHPEEKVNYGVAPVAVED